MPTFTKTEFAERRHVTKARVSQWIKEGKIPPEALVGEGRNAKIDEDIALQHLNRGLDPDQRAGHGLGTNLTPAPIAAIAPAASAPIGEGQPVDQGAAAPAAVVDDRQDRVLDARLEDLQRRNRRAAVEEAAANGRLTPTDEARRETAQEVRHALLRMDGALVTFATAIAAEYKLPQRDVLHILRAKWREERVAGAIDARERAGSVPETVGFVVDDDDQDDDDAQDGVR